jgi:hypothetical protein
VSYTLVDNRYHDDNVINVVGDECDDFQYDNSTYDINSNDSETN